MTLEASVSSIIRSLEQQGASRSFHYSLEREYDVRDVARGVRESGLGETVSAGFSGLESSLVGVALTLGVGLSGVAEGLAESNQRLAEIEHALRNPLAIAARERFDRGTKAFERGWLPEAETEFGGAVSDDPYLAIAHLMLGLTIIREPGRLADAEDPLAKAIRYGTPDEPALVTGAALVLARVHQDLGDEQAALAVAQAAHTNFPTCAELGLLRVRLGDDIGLLPETLRTAPELARVLALVDPDRFREAAAGADNSLLLDAAADLRDAVREVAALPQAACEEFGRFAEPSPGTDPGSRLLDACDLLARADSLINEMARSGRQALDLTARRLESDVQAERQLLEVGELRPLRERVTQLQAENATESRKVAQLKKNLGTNAAWHPERKGLESRIASLLCRASWLNFDRDIPAFIPQLEYSLAQLRSGRSSVFTGCVEPLTADELEERLDRARQLIRDLPGDVEQLRARDRKRIARGTATIEANVSEIQQLQGQITRLVDDPAGRRSALSDDVTSARDGLERHVAEMLRVRAGALTAGRLRPLSSLT